jgi:hypothetical protein
VACSVSEAVRAQGATADVSALCSGADRAGGAQECRPVERGNTEMDGSVQGPGVREGLAGQVLGVVVAMPGGLDVVEPGAYLGCRSCAASRS